MRFLALVLLALLTGGCASGPSTPVSPLLPFITLQEEPDGEHWRATWHLQQPARELRFEREGSTFRSTVFEVLSSGFKFERDGDADVLRTEGEAVSNITVRFPEYTRMLEKDYEFFQKFSDGSVAIYTGHLVAGAPAVHPEADFIRTFRFAGKPGSSLVVDGRVVPSPFTWRDEQERGAYIYFGGITPVQSKDSISVVDPGLPKWLEEETTRALPQLFAFYTERFGVELPMRPAVLFNYVDSGNSGYSNKGGTLPGQIQLTVDGAAWRERSDAALLHLFQFLAHEAVHLWNGQMVTYPGTEDVWMHEGGADAMAQRALLHLGLLDERAFLDAQSSALNECRKGLRAFPLRDVAKRREFSLYYTCGNALALVTESATGDRDLFRFWKGLIERARASGKYGTDDYFAVWRASGAKEEDVAKVRAFTEERAGPDELAAMLAAHGIVTVEDANPPDSYGQTVARSALMEILDQNCKGGFSFYTRSDGFLVERFKDCGAIRAPSTISAIGGHDVRLEGEKTWDALHERCGPSGTVGLRIADQTLDVPCTKPVTARPPYLRIERR